MTNAEIRALYKRANAEAGKISEWWAFMEDAQTNDPALHARAREVAHNYWDAEKRLREYKQSFRYRTKIRKYCNLHFPNDAYPWEVIKVISPITVLVREMDAVIENPEVLEFHIGGFAAHCSNQYAQRWTYTSNPDNEVRVLRKGKRGWGKGLWHMSDKPHKFYDYNL